MRSVSGSLVVVLVVTACVAAQEVGTPAAVAEHFYQLANDGKCAEARALFTAESISVLNRTLGQDGFVQFCSEKAGKAPLASLELRTAQTGAERATVSIMRTYKDGSMALESDALVRLGSSWKIMLGVSA